MRSLPRFLLILILTTLWMGPGSAREAADKTITTESLFREMIDLESLSRFPNPAYRTVQFSSFDRRSRLPGGPGWFANSDGFGGEPVPNFEKTLKKPGPDGVGEYEVADLKGPGAVVRLWSAAISGKVRLYIDDLNRPIYDGEAAPFFRRTYGCFTGSETLNPDLLERTIYQRDAAYAPLPFRKSLRIVWVGNLEEIHFYQVGVRLYEPGTKVVSFNPQDLVASSRAINDVLAVLADPDGMLGSANDSPFTFRTSLPPFEKRELFAIDGPQAVDRFVLKLESKDMDRALRQAILHIICDDVPWGQVQSPVGDFFGAAPGLNAFVSLPFSVQSDGTMVCRFPMPFQKSMKIMLENAGDQPINAAGSVRLRPYRWDEQRSMHFRARWRVDHGLIASNRDVQDLPFLLARGQGLYVGTASYIMNPSPVPTPYGSWWGEGDEKVFVDEDRFPSTFGTGSEDYYNYSWSSPDIFVYPYCGQPRNDGPGNRGFVTNFRWHILDPFPFRQAISFFMELYSHERTPGLSYARIAYHYARPGAFDDHLPIGPEDVRALELPAWEPAARMGARDFEFFNAEKAVVDPGRTNLRGSRIFAGGTALIWYPERPGVSKDFKITVGEAGKKRIQCVFVHADQMGTVSALLDGRSVPWADGAATTNLKTPGRTLLRMISLEPFELAAGEHVLTLKFEGAEADIQVPEVGLDFIGIQKVDK
ncbi:MAG: glycoside hydrolase family 172 protein [Candidatus Aminicenantales bacterium]